ncbi:GD17954 [Drosophila simulans]|uniref:GD17954 n=1 Tax=Drosophila simulans TaxID=7240 RepID=B4QLC5_DROSI|nr:GD17954 [Drosophila simulans]
MRRIWVLSYLFLIGLALVKTTPKELHSESIFEDEVALRSKSNKADALLTKTTTQASASNLFFKVITTTRPSVAIRRIVAKSKGKDPEGTDLHRKHRTHHKNQSKNKKKSSTNRAEANRKKDHSPHNPQKKT